LRSVFGSALGLMSASRLMLASASSSASALVLASALSLLWVIYGKTAYGKWGQRTGKWQNGIISIWGVCRVRHVLKNKCFGAAVKTPYIVGWV